MINNSSTYLKLILTKNKLIQFRQDKYNYFQMYNL